MNLVIEVRSTPVTRGSQGPQEPGSSQGHSYYSYTIIHPLVGNNDPLVAQVTEALAKLPANGVECAVTCVRRQDETPVITVAVGQWESMPATVSDVRMEYERLAQADYARRHEMVAAS